MAFSIFFGCFVYILQLFVGRVLSSKNSKNEQLSIKQFVYIVYPVSQKRYFWLSIARQPSRAQLVTDTIGQQQNFIRKGHSTVTHQVSLVAPVEWRSFGLLAYDL